MSGRLLKITKSTISRLFSALTTTSLSSLSSSVAEKVSHAPLSYSTSFKTITNNNNIKNKLKLALNKYNQLKAGRKQKTSPTHDKLFPNLLTGKVKLTKSDFEPTFNDKTKRWRPAKISPLSASVLRRKALLCDLDPVADLGIPDPEPHSPRKFKKPKGTLSQRLRPIKYVFSSVKDIIFIIV